MSGSGGDRSGYEPTTTPVPLGRPVPTGGAGGGGGGGGEGGTDPCDIVQDAPLNSPNPAVVPLLSVGDALDVVLTGIAPRQVLEVHTPNGGVAGSLTHVGHLALVRCIDAGNSYKAEVIQRTGGSVVVRVERN